MKCIMTFYSLIIFIKIISQMEVIILTFSLDRDWTNINNSAIETKLLQNFKFQKSPVIFDENWVI